MDSVGHFIFEDLDIFGPYVHKTVDSPATIMFSV